MAQSTKYLALAAGAWLLLAPAEASADSGELLLGIAANGELPTAVGADARAQVGIGDALALRGWLGGLYSGAAASGVLDAGAGVVWAWDVLAWVPELMVGVGLHDTRAPALECTLGLELRHFITPDWSTTIGVSGGWRSHGEFYAGASLGLWLRTK